MVYDTVRELATGFHSLRTAFKVIGGALDVSTHMALLRLSSGSFLVVDTVPLTAQSRAEIDKLTENGKLMAAVVAANPHHTLYFKAFQDAYPNTPFYGTPRHLRVAADVKWAGSCYDEEVLRRWAPDVEMQVPQGVEPDSKLSGLLVFHRESKTVFADDVIGVAKNPGFLMRMTGVKDGDMGFHPALRFPGSLAGPGLLPGPEAPWTFRNWLRTVIRDWDFANLVSAHTGEVMGVAKATLKDTLQKADSALLGIAKKRAEQAGVPVDDAWIRRWNEVFEYGK